MITILSIGRERLIELYKFIITISTVSLHGTDSPESEHSGLEVYLRLYH